ncbi:OmpA family protein [Mucilaginibacter sp. UC70_90]
MTFGKAHWVKKDGANLKTLAPNINTPYNELSPFIHPDDSTLYFSSDGWPGLGSKDLFVSRMDKDGKWQKPDNLGYPINTSGDEGGLSLTAAGDYAFFSSDNLNGLGGYDIYKFELPVKLRPHLVTYVKGFVKDVKTKAPLEAAIEIIDLESNLPVYQDYSDDEQGDFLATLTSGKNYALNISKSGYLFYSENFSLKNYKIKSPFNIVALLSPIEIGNKVILKNIFFDTNKFDLEKESKAELAKLIEFLGVNSTTRIEISGHTDNTGNHQGNQTLSENRAKSVYQYLVSKGIAPTRLIYKGYGETQPIASNTTEEDRAKNRRTEFMVITK